MTKEVKHEYNMTLPVWLAPLLPHLFLTPQHLLVREGKSDRLICDSAKRFTAHSTPINMMTSTSTNGELKCKYGTVLRNVLIRAYNLRITYKDRDICIHANDVAGAFCQLKHHPDVMPAFSCIVANTIFLQCGMTFGSDFSPANWEIIRRIAEILATALFDDVTFRDKHRKHLDRLNWSTLLRSKRAKFVPAKRDSVNKGVLDPSGTPVPTPHKFFVDNGILRHRAS